MMAVSSSGMGMIDHIEGRIAFLHTELKITETQTLEWNTFAEALRTNAQKLGETRTSMMTHMAGEQSATLSQRLEMQEQWLTARLAGTRSLRTSFETLYRVLTDEQKQTANELLAPHMGLMAMGQMGQMGQSPQ
jgi:hypothetical protein